MRITITPEDIQTGRFGVFANPASLALSRAAGWPCFVGLDRIAVRGGFVPTPPELSLWLYRWLYVRGDLGCTAPIIHCEPAAFILHYRP